MSMQCPIWAQSSRMELAQGGFAWRLLDLCYRAHLCQQET